MRSKFSVILKIQQRWWCLVLKLNMLGKTPETHQFPDKHQMCWSNISLHSKLAVQRLLHLQFAQQKCIYMYMERMYFFNTFLQMHFHHHGRFFFFFNCTIMCSYSCLMLKRGEKLTMQPNSSQFQQLYKNINIWTALFFILPTKSDCCTSKELFAGLY